MFNQTRLAIGREPRRNIHETVATSPFVRRSWGDLLAGLSRAQGITSLSGNPEFLYSVMVDPAGLLKDILPNAGVSVVRVEAGI